jgi:hypothetical protein
MGYTARSITVVTIVLAGCGVTAAQLPIEPTVEAQPLAAQVRRVVDALEYLGTPLPVEDKKALEAALEAKDVKQIQAVMDKHCVAGVRIGKDPKEALSIQPGPAKRELIEQGWRMFLVKVFNDRGAARAELRAESPNALPLHIRSSSSSAPKVASTEVVTSRFLDLEMFGKQPLLVDLSGLAVEYRILQIYCRDAGRREAKIGFALYARDETQSNQPKRLASPSGNQLSLLFSSLPAVIVKLQVVDDDGKPTTGSFTFRDRLGHVYPSLTRRLAPDFFFHAQVYRRDGETVALPPGRYTVTYTRGPEYLTMRKEITVPNADTHTEKFELKRWVHPAAKGWYSGDHHVHAAGCAHYESPTEGVTPEDMMRHILGEDLNVGCVLSWGPCWYHQKRYFEGKTHRLSTPDYLMRYDVEVSGFPSSHCGHICLLRLRQQDYPGTKLIDDWPSWDLPIFRWAKGQGGVVGFAHSGWGLEPSQGDPGIKELPNYIVPKMNGIGANEYLVDIVHDACDFISTVDTPSVWELNAWYHTLNCGYRCRISGETDFPCIYGERVGLGRSYVHLDGKLNFDDWAEGIKKGRCYVSDGRSHLMDFTVNGKGVGLDNSEVRLTGAGTLKLRAAVAALLEPTPTEETERIRNSPLNQKPYWDIERARIGNTRKVPVAAVVNGKEVARQEITADGSAQSVEFSVPIQQSGWVALRILPSSHTNPVFVLVNDQPIRASKRSADWCLKAIDACWKQKERNIHEPERGDARKAYDVALEAYRKIKEECQAD